MDSNNGKILILSKINKSFGSNTVLKEINLEINKGETVTILGKSGTGKSVILKCIIGLLYPDSGSVKVFGENITELNEDELKDVRKKSDFFSRAALCMIL